MSARELAVLYGRAASGKSEYLFERLKVHADKGENAILLTEEQSTYEAEKALCARYGGLLGVEVLSVSRFCQRVLQEAGLGLKYLSPQGRCMVLRKIASRHKKELALFSRAAEKRGFAQEADTLLTRLTKSAVSPEDLKETAAGLGAGALKDKLNDISLLYKETELYLADKYLTEYSLLERAQNSLRSSALAKSHIYVDSADLSGERAFLFLGALLDVCLSLTVTVLLDSPESEEPLFAPGRELREKLMRLAAGKGLSFKEIHSEPREDGDPALRHLEKYIYREHTEPFLSKPQSLFFHACEGRREEAEALAERIADLTMEEGFRYRDIAVTLTDKNAYLPLVRRAFRRRGIPIFEDSPRTLSSHAAADLVLSAVRFAANGSMEDVLHIAKGGLTEVTNEEAERFENHVLRYGLYGSALFKPFGQEGTPPEAESARLKLSGPLEQLKEDLAGEDKSARARVEAVYRYLTALRVSEKLQENAAALLKAGENGEAQLLSEVWARLMEILHQMYHILDTDTVNLKDLPGILEEGICATTLSPLPGNQDRVTVGDIDRSRNPQRDVLFVLGANEGFLPPKCEEDPLFSNAELDTLLGHGLKLWDNTEKEMAKDRTAVYTVLTKARKRLYITYALNADKEALPPSVLLDMLKDLFPALFESEDAKAAPLLKFPYPGYAAGAFEQTLRESADRDKQKTPIGTDYAERLTYFKNTAPFDGTFKKLKAVSELHGRGGRTLKLGRELAGEVYGRMRLVSASRLETFNKCPFRHYVEYGLKAKERKELQEKITDAGTFLHDVLEEYVRRVKELDPTLQSITEAQSDEIIDAYVEVYKKKHNDGIYEQDEILKAGLFLQTECAKRCAHAVLRQFQCGDFLPYAVEYDFGNENSEVPALRIPVPDSVTAEGRHIHNSPLYLHGRIDRLDKSADGKLARIIDYKSGSEKEFRPEELAAGLTLQLPLYLEAVTRTVCRAAGMYYMPLLSAPKSEKNAKKPNMLSGITDKSEEVITATERELGKASTIITGLKRVKSKGNEASGNLCEADEFNRLIEKALEVAGNTGKEIMEGAAGINPYRIGSNKTSCSYCPYTSVCRYSPQSAGYKYRRIKDCKLQDLVQDPGEEKA